MEVCKKCGCGKFVGKMVDFNKPWPYNDELSYSRFIVRCSNGHFLGAWEKPKNLAEIKTHHTKRT